MKKEFKIFGIPLIFGQNSDEKYFKFGNIPLYKKIINNQQICNINSSKSETWPEIRIAIQLKGGIGDQIIGCNYVKALRDKLADNEVKIDVYCRPFIGDLFLKNEDFIDAFFPEIDFNLQDGLYDIYLRLDRFPIILKCNDKKIQQNQILYKYILMCQNFKKQHNNVFFTGRSEFDSICNIYTLIKGQKRYNQMDIDSFLGMSDKFLYKPEIQATNILHDFNLNSQKFITVHRGVDTNRTKDSNKLWPSDYYEQLIQMIKQNFPEYQIVQLGVSADRCPSMRGVDINLVGKTTIADIAYILSNCLLHIDGEGGMVHIRHAVGGGKSVVFFGPTSVDFYGYGENINLTSKVCAHWCEHIKERWDEGCLITNGEPLCMRSISPKEAFEKIESYLNERG